MLINLLYIFGVIFLYLFSRRGGDSRYIVELILMILGVIWILKNNKKSLKDNKILYICVCVYILSLGSVYFMGVHIKENIMLLLEMSIFSLGFLVTLMNLKLEDKIVNRILPLFMFFSLGSIYRGLKDIYIHRNILSDYRVAGGTYTTVYALEIGIYILIGIFAYFIYKNKIAKYGSIVYILLNMIILIGTKSRNTMLMLPITLLLVYFIYNKKRGIIILLTGLILGGIVLKNSYRIPYLHRLQTVSSLDNIKKNARYKIYLKGLELGKENLFIGQGFYKYKNEGFQTEKNGQKFQHFHNIFLETYVTEGIIVLLAYIGVYISIFIKIFKSLNKTSKEDKKYLLMGLGVFIFSILYGQFESTFYNGKVYSLGFIILTLSFLKINAQKDNISEEKC